MNYHVFQKKRKKRIFMLKYCKRVGQGSHPKKVITNITRKLALGSILNNPMSVGKLS